MDRRQALGFLGSGFIGLTGCSAVRLGGSDDQGTESDRVSESSESSRGPAPARFSEYAADRATLEVVPGDFSMQKGGFRIAVFTRRYPRGAVLARGIRPVIQTERSNPVSVPVSLERTKARAGGFAHHVAEFRPANRSTVGSTGTGHILAETDRFELTPDGSISPAPHPTSFGARTGETFERHPVEGAYEISITAPAVSPISFRVFKSEYVIARERPRPDGYPPYVDRAIDSGLAERVARRVHEATPPSGEGENDRSGTLDGEEQLRDERALEIAIAAVQALPYVPEPHASDGDEYIKFPAETLVEGGGDCEDTAVVLAAILEARPFDRAVAVIHPPNHVGVGIAGSGLYGTYYSRNGTRYFFVETTGPGWGVGELPKEYADSTALVFPV